MKGLFSDGHPLGYHIAAVALAMLSLGAAFASTILAEDSTTTSGGGTTTMTTSSPLPTTTTTTTSTTSGSSTTSCSYNYSDWSDCKAEGKRYRTVTSTSPSGCTTTTSPKLVESCTYIPPACSYSYSSWSDCKVEGLRSRTVTGTSPSGCVQTTAPRTVESCTYTAPTGTSTTTSATETSPTTTSTTSGSTTTACSYNYSDWSDCKAEGKRSRTVTSTTPSGCVQTTAPRTVESCTYTAPTADQCVFAYSDWRACQSDGKRKRDLISKSPSGCQEYVRPVLEQSCVYDASVAPTSVTLSTGSLPATEAPGGDTTPSFSFKNVGDGLTIRGTYEIKSEVAGAKSVEYYLVPTGSNTYKYIGSGTKVSETEWRLVFRSGEFPNGEFYLRAKIKNIYGEYGGGQRKIAISNDRSGTTVATTSGSTETGFATIGMTEVEKQETLKQFRANLSLPATDTDEDETEAKTTDEQKKEIFDFCGANPDKCELDRDTDKDGMSDIDELRYGTNPKAADSDLDGFIDSDEVKNGFDPLKYSAGDQSDRVIFESPKVAGEVKEKIYAVETVEVKEETDESGVVKKKMKLAGKGLPNSFVTVYIYSDPIVLTVKTDDNGDWTYELDKELEEGEHEVYVAITDNTGKITAKSQPLGFIKTAQAVTVIPSVEAAQSAATQSVSGNRAQRDLLILVSIVIAALAVTLAVIGLIKHRHMTAKDGVIEP